MQFTCFSRCLDSILHAEHKSILEEMRFDYNLTQSTDKKKNSSNGSAGSESEVVPNGNESNSPIENTIGMGSMAEYREDKIQTDTPMAIGFSLNLRHLLGSLNKNVNQNSLTKSRCVAFFIAKWFSLLKRLD